MRFEKIAGTKFHRLVTPDKKKYAAYDQALKQHTRLAWGCNALVNGKIQDPKNRACEKGIRVAVNESTPKKALGSASCMTGIIKTPITQCRRIVFGGFMRLLALLLLLSFTACATTPLTITQASAVPSSRILAPQLIAQRSNTGSLIVKRDSGFMGSACTVRVFVDAVPVADLAPSEKIELYVPLGEHSVVVSANGICGGGTSEAAVVLMPERQRILRIASGQSGDIYLQPSAF